MFCQYVVGTGNNDGMSYADAARKAGYKDSPYLPETAGQLARRPIIKAEIDRLTSLARATLNLNAESWQRELLYQYQRVRDDDATTSLRALELWGKHLGLLDAKRDDNSTRAAEVLATLASLMKPALPETPDKNPGQTVTVEARLLPGQPAQ